MIQLLLAIVAVPAVWGSVTINELSANASGRLLRHDSQGVPHVGRGPAWYTLQYSDALWRSGTGPIGYGAVSGASFSIVTNVQPLMQHLTPTLYMRRTFEVTAAQAASSDPLRLGIEYNDGFVAYLNGVEIARRNAGPAKKFIYHDQPAYNRESFSGTATIPNTTLTEVITIGPANASLQVGQNILAIHLLNANASDGTLYVRPSLFIASSPTAILATHSDSWKYFPGVVEPSGNLYDPERLGSGRQNVLWGKLSFQDFGWLQGAGPFGFGNVGTLGTNVQAGMLNIASSLYVRQVFNVSAAQAADPQQLRLVVTYDDGFVAYINGVEVARRRIGDAGLVGTPNVFTPFDAVANTDQGSVQSETIIIDSASEVLVQGSNVLALQGHNFTKNNADFRISARLQTATGTALASETSSAWRYFIGVSEPVESTTGEEQDEVDTPLPEEPDGEVDWVELHNPTGSPVSMLGWRLTDNASNLAKWIFPDVTIPAGGYLVVICDGLNIREHGANGYVHTNFKLASEGEYLGLVNPGGQIVSQITPGFPRQYPFQTYARDGDGTWRYSDTPTPGAPNEGPFYYGVVADPMVSHPGRFYSSSQSVTLTSETPGATIRYTLNGSVPDETSAIASSAIFFSGTNAGHVLRARAYLPNYLPSNVITHTYLIGMNSARRSLPAFCLTGDLQQAFYRPFGIFAIVNNGSSNYAGGIWSNRTGTTTLNPPNAPEDPTLYNAPMQSGKPAERAIAVEQLHSDATPDLRTGAFLRAAGSPHARPRYVLTNHNSATPNTGTWSSSTTQKPQLNLFFRGDVGPSPLSYPLVPGSVVQNYKNIRLRAGKNDISNPFIRDEFVRRLFLDMGQVSPRGDFVNVFINGQLKGYFNICERPREPFFQEARGTTNAFDVRHISVVADGDSLAFTELMNFARTTSMASVANYQAMQTRLDVVNFADYVILNVHAAMADWPGNNYIMERERAPTGVYRFTVWDAEGGYGGFGRNPNHKSFNDIVSGSIGSESVPTKLLYTVLRNSPEWRLLVADRIQKHFFTSNGSLSNTNLNSRWNLLRTKIQPMMSEMGNGTLSMTSFNLWMNGAGDTSRYTLSGSTIVNSPTRRVALFDGYFDDTAGGAFVQPFFKDQGLWPATSAPTFSQMGGNIPNGFTLTMGNPNGTGVIYYTTNGFDPRAAGGAPQGMAYTGPVPVNQTTVVKARVRSSLGEWSPLTEATFTSLNAPPLIFSEIMYNPPSIGAVDGQDYEFLEIKNIGSHAVSLAGMSFSQGITYAFPAGAEIVAGGHVIVARVPSRFAEKYPQVTVPVFGPYAPTNLSNSGEQVTLVDLSGNTVYGMTYGDQNVAGWPAAADGGGYSLVPVDPNGSPNPNDPYSWRLSTHLGGSPGADDPLPTSPVLISEVLTNPSAGGVDAVELHNPGMVSLDIGYWWLSDRVSAPRKYQFPSPTLIPAGGYLVVTEADFNPTPGSGTSFAFSKDGGEDVVLSSGDAGGNLTGFTHRFLNYPATETNVSLGRYVDSLGKERFVQQAALTLGAANAGPRVGPVVITEIMYHGPASRSGIDYIELANITGEVVRLYHPQQPGAVWRVLGIEYEFPPGTELAPGQILILTSADPAEFRSTYGVPEEVAVMRYSGGSLTNDLGELVAIQKPANSDLPPTVWIDSDAVYYRDAAPWPTAAAGGGSSLERINWHTFGDDVINWRASAPFGSPGILTPLNFDQWRTVHFSGSALENPAISGPDGNPDGDGLTNFWEFALGKNPNRFDADPGWQASMEFDGIGGPFLTVRYRRNLGAKDISWHVDTGGQVGAWTLDGSVTGAPPLNHGDGTETVTRRDMMTPVEALQRFIRLRVQE